MFPTILSFFPLLILSSLPLSKALVNLTIDDQDTKISYIPRSSWTRNHITGWDYGDTHMWTTDPDAYATITMKCAFSHLHEILLDAFSHLNSCIFLRLGSKMAL